MFSLLVCGGRDKVSGEVSNANQIDGTILKLINCLPPMKQRQSNSKAV